MSLHNTKKIDKGQSIQGVFEFWKLPGETLAVMLRRFREEQGISSEEKITYAGRLDPMAEGIVPLLVGEARFQKEKLMKAAKTYEVDILLGIKTDTADMLGMVEQVDLKQFSEAQIQEAIEQLRHTKELPYPEYSSRPVDGKPLFVHARAGNKVLIPIKNVLIHSLELKGIQTLPLNEVIEKSVDVIQTVQGDFRQEEIVSTWKEVKGEAVQVVSIICTASSGTYMRSLAERMGELLGVPALAYRIVRTNIEE